MHDDFILEEDPELELEIEADPEIELSMDGQLPPAQISGIDLTVDMSGDQASFTAEVDVDRGGSIEAGIYTVPTSQLWNILPEEPVTPTEAQQVLGGPGYLMRDSLTVEAIPERYKDITIVTAAAKDVKAGKQIVGADGSTVLGTYAYDAIGDNAEFIKTVYPLTTTPLADTLYNGWTPSTTAKVIKASESLSEKLALDLEEYEYMLRWIFSFNAAYAAGTVPKAAVDRIVMEIYQIIYRRPGTLAAIESESNNLNVYTTYLSPALMKYWGATGSVTVNYAASYGVYIGATAPAFSSTSSTKPNLTIKTPAISARCSATYFSTAMAAAINQNSSICRLKGEAYRLKPRGAMPQVYDSVVHTFNDDNW